MNETNSNHVELYQLNKLASLLDEFEKEMDAHISGKVKWEEDYPNILLQVAGKASLTMRAIILNSRVYFVTTLDPPAVMGWYLRQSIYPFAR